jgi:hypothetical protein
MSVLQTACVLAQQSLLELERLKVAFERRGSWKEDQRRRINALAELLTEKQLKVDEHKDAGERRRVTREVQYVVSFAERLLGRVDFATALSHQILQEDLALEPHNLPEWAAALSNWRSPESLAEDVRTETNARWNDLPWGVRLLVARRVLSGRDNTWWFQPLPPPVFGTRT